jgi:UDP-N-acetylglucosamine 2-epimerase (hydrolysing)
MREKPRKILFITGTRADFGKLQPLMKAVDSDSDYELIVFATGMHTLKLYGSTIYEVHQAKFKNVHNYMNQIVNEPMDLVFANTVTGLARYVHEMPPDMIVVHGDRIETLAGAVVGALRNTLVAHIEGGELSGTVDEVIRHAVSKLSHLHLVANEEAASRLRQMGECSDSIFVIGSPDIDVMNSASLPSLETAKARYNVPFDNFAIVLFHPVTTENDQIGSQVCNLVDALIESKRNYIVIYPNNDEGSHIIINEYKRLKNRKNFRVFPSVRFEYFLPLLRSMDFIIGNSSAGVREAPFYGRPAVNIGSRQMNRYSHSSIINTTPDRDAILAAISTAIAAGPSHPSTHFGDGNSVERFMSFLTDPAVWNTPKQKQFIDLASLMEAAL